MITRYTQKKWWSMKEDPEGQYVSYLEHQEALDAMRYENDNLWERVAQQTREHKLLAKDRQEWIDRHEKVWSENGELRSDLGSMKLNAITLVLLLFSAFVIIGFLTCH